MRLHFLTIAEAADRIATGALRSSELVEAYLDRIDAFDPVLNSYITVTADLARAQAGVADAEIAAGRYRGPLHGIPIGLKDMIETAGIPTTAHSRLLAGNVPSRDAAVVAKLREAGAVLLGKQACHEFAHGGPSFDLPWPPARNPWNPQCYSGGSSSGSAVAAAAGLAAGSIGTDTGGSVRTPSYLCGTVGLKPTFGLVSRRGVIPFSPSCDHVGPMARTVSDCALLLQAIAGHDPEDRNSARVAIPDYRAALKADLKGLRIGVVRHFWEEDRAISAELARAVDDAIDVLANLGATVEEIRLRPLSDYYKVRIILTETELFSRHERDLCERADEYGEHFLGRILPAVLFSAADYIAAQRARQAVIEEMQAVYRRCDLLLTAGGGPAPDLHDHDKIGRADRWTQPNLASLFTLSGAPAVAVPCGFSREGMPLGMQLAGRPFEDATVLRAAFAYEQATRWCDQRPPDPGRIPFAPPPPSPPRAAQADDMDMLVSAARAGLKLDAVRLGQLADAAPHALDFAKSVRGFDYHNHSEANTFSLDRVSEGFPETRLQEEDHR